MFMRETMTEEISKIQTRKYIWTIVVCSICNTKHKYSNFKTILIEFL